MRCPLALKDARPNWERRSKKCAVDFRSLEDCEEPPWDLLQSAIEGEIRNWPDPPSQANLVLTSFRLVIKKEEKDWDWLQLGLPGPPSGSVSSAGAAVALIAIGGAILVTETALILGKAGVDEVIRARREHRGPPYNLHGQYSTGVTCDIQACVILEWPDGRRSDADLHAVVNPTGTTESSSKDHVVEIHHAIQEATDHMAQEWVQKNSHAKSAQDADQN